MTTDRPPQAPTEPHEHTEHGVARPDPYAWMHDAEEPRLRAHLVAERSWYDAAVAHLHSLVADLRSEMVARVPATELSPVWTRRRFSYYTVTPAGRDYPRICRKYRHDSASTEEILLDVEILAEGQQYAELGATLVSPDEDLLAWSV